MTDVAVRDAYGFAGVEYNSIGTDASSFDDQAAQVDDIGRTGVHRYAGATRRYHNSGRTGAVVHDADRFGDDHWAIVAWIEHVNVSAGIGLGDSEGKGA